ncbi:MAG: hypothetical protein A2516_01195 [Alphaproteobacteria bacterium RIFOXYD12_FULL_60_8]|nr:MAG: hypothetical protein A2516_01195 [Alphaproteobacteria bacterium RIFOXYD12_FULL_60_8]
MLPEVADFPAFKDQEVKKFTHLIDRTEDLLHLPDGMTLLRTLSPHPMGGMMATYEDVTDILVLESSFKTLLAVQRETLDHLNEAVAVFGDDGRLKLSNPAYASLWNLKPDDLTDATHLTEILDKQKPFFSSVPDWPALKRDLTNLLSARAPTRGRIERSDGVMLSYLCFPLSDGGVLLAYEDVSNTARVELALHERNDALRAANRLKSEFISNVSNELSRPLSTLSHGAQALLSGELTAPQRAQATDLAHAAQRLERLIHDIADLASVEAGSVALELDAFDISAMIEEVLSLVRERVQDRGLNLVVERPAESGWMVADEKRLKRVLYNLMDNSIKFTPEDGKITLSVAKFEDRVEFVVADTGIGISAKDCARVFNSFAQTVAGIEAGGSGLGLSLVKTFVELHGGTVTLDSTPHKGTTVTCRLPTGGDRPAPSPTNSGAKPAGKKTSRKKG